MAETPSPAVHKALQILRLLAAEESGLTLSEIAHTLSLPKSTTHGLLRTLHMEGFLEKGALDNRFRIGLAAFEVGSAYADRSEVVHLFSIHAHALASACDQAVFLAVEGGDRIVVIAREESNGPIRCVVPLGSRYPLWPSAAGKVFLASYGESRQHLALQTLRASSPRGRDGLDLALWQRELLLVRSRGYAIEEETFGPGTRSLAAPVRDHTESVVAAVGVGIAVAAVETLEMEALATAVIQMAADLSQRLGYRPGGLDSLAAGRDEAAVLIGRPGPIRRP